jgi:hypothetical protein
MLSQSPVTVMPKPPPFPLLLFLPPTPPLSPPALPSRALGGKTRGVDCCGVAGALASPAGAAVGGLVGKVVPAGGSPAGGVGWARGDMAVGVMGRVDGVIRPLIAPPPALAS